MTLGEYLIPFNGSLGSLVAVRSHRTKTVVGSYANDLIDRSSFPEVGCLFPVDSGLARRIKRKRGVAPGREASFRPNLQRSYLNYSEKLISFFLPLRGNPLNVSASDVDLAFKENLGMRITVQSWWLGGAAAE